MSARSFTEEFGLDAGHFPDDALSASYAITDLQHGCSIPRYQEAIDTLAKSVPALIAQRDSARDWAVALENRLARVDRALDELRKRERDAGIAQGEAQRPYDYSEGHYTGTRSGIRESVIAVAAALTGGEDDEAN